MDGMEGDTVNGGCADGDFDWGHDEMKLMLEGMNSEKGVERSN